jgi:hypothetical protein
MPLKDEYLFQGNRLGAWCMDLDKLSAKFRLAHGRGQGRDYDKRTKATAKTGLRLRRSSTQPPI